MSVSRQERSLRSRTRSFQAAYGTGPVWLNILNDLAGIDHGFRIVEMRRFEDTKPVAPAAFGIFNLEL
jgi:hypothetical protein